LARDIALRIREKIKAETRVDLMLRAILSLMGGTVAGKGWRGSRGKRFLLLGVLVAKSLPQSRDCKIKEGAQLQRHRALAGVDNADRHR